MKDIDLMEGLQAAGLKPIVIDEDTFRDHQGEEQKTYTTGAKRSIQENRFDLICPTGLRRLAARYALGAKKYSDMNWTKGIPMQDCLNHLIAHIVDYMQHGNERDDNLAAVAWNAIAMMHFEENCQHHNAPFRKENQ